MDTILLTVTGVSLALAAVMGVLLARMLREERRRSDARVALLSELAADPAGPAMRDDVETADSRAIAVPRVSDRERPQRRLIPAPERPIIQSKAEVQPAVQSQPVVQRVASELPVQAEPPVPPAVQPPTQARPVVQPRALEQPVHVKPSRFLVLDEPDDFELRPAADEVQGVQDLFHEPERRSAWPRRLAAVGGLAAVVAVVVFGWSNLRFRGRKRLHQPPRSRKLPWTRHSNYFHCAMRSRTAR